MIILPLLATQANAFAVFDSCAKTHASLKAASAVITVKGKASSRYEVAFIQPDRARIRLSSVAAGGTAASERVFTLVGSKVYGLDLKTNEWLERSAGTTGNIAYRLSSVVGQLDDPANILLIPSRAKDYLGLFKTMPGWVVSRNSSDITVSTSLKNIGDYSFKFRADDKRLLSADIHTRGQTRTVWTYNYRTTPTSIAFTPPARARKVAMFQDRAAPPAFESKAAQAIYQASVGAYRKLPNLNYTVTDGITTFDVNFTRNSAIQKNRLYSFSYSNGSLAFGSKSIKCNAADIELHLERAKIGVEPVLKALINHKNPVERLLTQGMKVRVIGNLKIGQVMNDLIEGKSKEYRVMLAIRRDTHLISSATSENYDGKGNRVARVERRFTYR
ncbi:MAG: hypothetical protein ABL949_14300 [Fimbriimonadaceae bacterium]